MDPLPSAVPDQLRALPSYFAPAGDYVPATALIDPAWWREPVAAYSRWIGTPHAAAGAACCLQHYAGRVLPVVLRVWALTGRLMSLAHEHWQVHVDAHGATVGVRHDERILRDVAGAGQVGQAVVAHLAPLTAAALTASNLTRAAALGGPAASLAGAVTRMHAAVAPRDRPAVAEAGAEVIAAVERLAGRPLITLETDGEDPALLLQHRRTCCLIRLGPRESACDTCPQLPRDDRVRRQRDRHRRTAPVSIVWGAAP